MKFHNEYLIFHTKKHRAYVHITPQIETIRQKSGVKEGLVLVSAMHITAGVYANSSSSPPSKLPIGRVAAPSFGLKNRARAGGYFSGSVRRYPEAAGSRVRVS
jgi:Uncharacterised protein family UPF0047